MKKAVICFAFAVLAAFSWGDTITNTVVIVSNYYNNVYHESVVTQKVKNTHVEYYFTNNVYTVSNRTLVVSQTNINVNVINTNFGPWIAKCEAAAVGASNALSSATSAASASASSATAAASSASAADAFAHSASNYANQAGSSADSAISTINTRINNFDTSVNTYLTRVSDAVNSGVSTVNSTMDSGLSSINTRINWFDDHALRMIQSANSSIGTSTNLMTKLYSSRPHTNYYYHVSYFDIIIALDPERYTPPHENSMWGVYDIHVINGTTPAFQCYVTYDANGLYMKNMMSFNLARDVLYMPQLYYYNVAPGTLPEGNTSYGQTTVSFLYKRVEYDYIDGDMGVYSSDGIRKGTLATTANVSQESSSRSSADSGIISKLTSLSNWVENAFQKK